MMVIGFLLGCVGGAIIMGCICLDTMRLMRQGHDQIVARLDARIAQLAKGWQPIDTAPRDGSMIVMRHKSDTPFVGYWYRTESVWTDPNCGVRQPTHWTPLPCCLDDQIASLRAAVDRAAEVAE